MTPIRSLHINTERTWRGGEKQTLLLVEGLRERGHVAELVCPPATPLAERARAAGVTVHAFPLRGELNPRAIARIRGVLQRGEFDVLQMHTSHAHTLGVLARGARQRPLTVVNRRVDFSILRRGMMGLNRIKYRYGVDRYIAISRAIREVLIRDGVDAARIEVVHSGVDAPPPPPRSRAEILAELGLPEDSRVVGNVAHLASHKGQAVLLRALARLTPRFPELRAVIVGEGAERPALEAEIARLDLGERVCLAGFQEDVSSYLAAFDVFVMPSILEGLCTSIIDALHFGLPVIASDTGGIPEIVEHERTGLLVVPGSEEGLAAALERVLGDAALASALGEAGRRRAEQEFSVAGMVEGTLAVYRGLLGREAERRAGAR